jgi:hypothetical protein
MNTRVDAGAAGGCFLALTALLLAIPCAAHADTDQNVAVDPVVVKAPTNPVSTLPEPRKKPRKPDLRTRTKQFEPGRFNLSADGGRGLIRAASPYSLLPGEAAGGFSVLNFDRNPGDVDFFEYGFQGAIGLPGRVELFVRGLPVVRTNSVNQDPTGYPVPPLDLIIDTYPTLAARQQPYFLFAQEVPFKSYYLNGVTIDPPGHGAFASSSGDVTVGAKINLLSQDAGSRIGVGVRGYVEIPTERPSYNVEDWRKAAGSSGKTDIGADVLIARRFGDIELLVNAGYKHMGDPDKGLRVQLVDSSQWGTPGFVVGPPVETGLDLKDQLILNAGTSLRAFNVRGLQFWLLGELGYTRYVGGGTSVERLVHPFETRLGIQANTPKFPRVSIGAAWQLLVNSAGNGTTRRTRLQTPDGRGDINFTDQVDWELAAEVRDAFTSQGLTFWERSSRVFATNNPEFDQWRNVPSGDTPVVAMGGGNILGFITWRIN